MPVCGGAAPGSVLHSTAISPARRALVIHIFEPVSRKSSPSRAAVVRMLCRSEPPSGSVSAIVARISPVASRGR